MQLEALAKENHLVYGVEIELADMSQFWDTQPSYYLVIP